ncbi:hypothetical protein BDV19DRAFT_394050 [Aspergillus venezuelensis]
MSTPPLSLQLDGHDDWSSGNYTSEAAFSILQRHLSPDEDQGLPLERAFRALNRMAYFPELPSGTALEPSREKARGKSRGVVMVMSRLLIHIVHQIPYHHPAQDKLVELIVRLSQSKHFIFPSYIEHTRMAYLMEELGEENFFIFDFDGSTYRGLTPEVINTRAMNLSAFTARLQSAGFDDDYPSDILRAMIQLEKEVKQEEEEAIFDPAALSARIIAASMWIIYAGDYYHRAVVLSHPPVTTGRRSRDPDLDLELWKFWMRRFGEVASLAGVSEEARERSQEAVGIMEALVESKEILCMCIFVW